MMRRFAVTAVLLGVTVGAAHAQYYQPPSGYAPGGYPPPGGYSPPPGGYPPPEGGYPSQGTEGYPPPQPEGALPPRVEGYGPPGSQCNAYFETRYGTRQRLCPMGVAKPVGAPCACPPRGPYGQTAQGQVIP